MKYIQIFIFFFTLSACGQNMTEMKTPDNGNEKFTEFIAKKKFLEENFYPRIKRKNATNFYKKINQVAIDFKTISESEKPTDRK